MRHFDYIPTTRVIFGENTLDQLGAAVQTLAARHALLVTDPGIVQAGHAEKAHHYLCAAGITVAQFADVAENPTTEHVDRGVEFARDNGPIDCIVALGGGSAMDCAKGINFLLTNGGKMSDYWGVGKAQQPLLPSIGIPTTAGTGSEGQSFALISQADSHRKMACGDIKARFRIVILDPLLARTVPREVAAVTGMDAISHALESYVTSRRNPMSQLFASEAWRRLNNNFERILSGEANDEAWGNMLLGAHYAGLAIENSMLGAAHACANPLTANYGITHGIAVGLMLPHVIRFNADVVGEDYHRLAAIAELPGSQPGYLRLTDRLGALREHAGLPHHLEACAIPADQLPALAEQAAEQWTGNFNPRPVDRDTLLEIYRAAYKG